MLKKSTFTLLEILFAMAIFASGILVLIEKRDLGLDATHYASNLFEAQKIVDEILADYRLHPFSEEVRPLKKEYHPFNVVVTVAKESVNILPEEWRIEETNDGDYQDDENKKKKRIILRVTVDVEFGTLSESNTKKHYKISTLIRHIELEDEEE